MTFMSFWKNKVLGSDKVSSVLTSRAWLELWPEILLPSAIQPSGKGDCQGQSSVALLDVRIPFGWRSETCYIAATRSYSMNRMIGAVEVIRAIDVGLGSVDVLDANGEFRESVIAEACVGVTTSYFRITALDTYYVSAVIT